MHVYATDLVVCAGVYILLIITVTDLGGVRGGGGVHACVCVCD